MEYAPKVLHTELKPAQGIGNPQFKSHIFYEPCDNPHVIVREMPPDTANPTIREAKTAKRLLDQYKSDYDIAVAPFQYIIAPGDSPGMASVVCVVDKIGAKDIREGDSYGEACDELNQKLLNHAKDLYENGGLYNTEFMHLHQYVYDGSELVLVDIEPHFMRMMAPPNGRIYGEIELVPILQMAREITENALEISQIKGKRSDSEKSIKDFLWNLEVSGPMKQARNALLETLHSRSLDPMQKCFDDDDEPSDFFVATCDPRAATYVRDV